METSSLETNIDPDGVTYTFTWESLEGPSQTFTIEAASPSENKSISVSFTIYLKQAKGPIFQNYNSECSALDVWQLNLSKCKG